jgi:hypothetical protein
MVRHASSNLHRKSPSSGLSSPTLQKFAILLKRSIKNRSIFLSLQNVYAPSSLYSQHLTGKTIAGCNWHNESNGDYRCLSIFFTDDTIVSFRFHTFVDEQVEPCDFVGGDLSNEKLITPKPITKPKDGK